MQSRVPTLLLLTLALILAVKHGGFAPTDWYPATLFALALAALAYGLGRRRAPVPPRAYTVAVLALGLFTVWSYASVVWADVPADAWDGANRTLLYWLLLYTVGVRPWSPRHINVALALVVIGVTGIAGGLMVFSAYAKAPEVLFLDGRLSEPIGYANATAAVLLIALWPALHFATSRSIFWLIRGLALGAGCLLVQVALLTQSRGAAIALICTALVYVGLTPRRWPAVGAIVVLVALTAAAWQKLISVESSAEVTALVQRLHDAREAISASGVVAILVGSLAALAGARVRSGRGASPRWRRGGDAAILVLAVSGALAAGALLATNGDWLDARWQDFKTSGYEVVDKTGRFAGSLGSGRYDFYRVAYEQFERHPARGIGADNFSVPYLIERRTGEAPLYPHSLVFRILAQLGIVGSALFVTFLGAVFAAGFSGWGRRSIEARSAAVGAFTASVFWLVQGAGDWLWEMPAVSMLAMVLVSMFARSDYRARPSRKAQAGWWRALPMRLAVVVAFLLAFASLVMPWLSAKYLTTARQLQQNDPVGTYATLSRAADLNALSADPLIGQALIARSLGRIDLARSNLERALNREPRNWFAHFELGLLDPKSRADGQAVRALTTAARLNPRQPLIGEVRRRVQRGIGFVPEAIEQQLLRQHQPRRTRGRP